MNGFHRHFVAVIGAGPAGLYAAQELALQDIDVLLLNRDIRPGGLAEYGIYPEKIRMKEGLRRQFRQILEDERITYAGNVIIGENRDVTLDDLRCLGVQALLITVGAQGTKSLELPGENLRGVIHAKDLVYHYNLLPPFSEMKFPIGERVIIVGVGNVMADITRYLIYYRQVKEVTAIARRGPAEVKFDRREMVEAGSNFDYDAFDREIARVAPVMQSIQQDPEAARSFILDAVKGALPPASTARFCLRFLSAPARIEGNERGGVSRLVVEQTRLALENGSVKALRTGILEELPADTVIFAIGDRVDPGIGLPVNGLEYCIAGHPRYPVEDQSYEVVDAQGKIIEDVFVAGWARKASTGMVGLAKKDGLAGAALVQRYLKSLPESQLSGDKVLSTLRAKVPGLVTNTELKRLFQVEEDEKIRRQAADFKFATNAEMLDAIRSECRAG